MRPFGASLVLVSVLLLAACQPVSDAPASPQTEPPAYTLSVTEAPFAYAIHAGDAPLLRQHAADTMQTAVHFITEDGVQYLTEATAFDTTAHALTATYATTDGRVAEVSIQPAEHGGARVSIEFEPSQGILHVGETLFSSPSEKLHGLTVRVIGGSDWDARNPETPVALDRRGTRVPMVANGTISLQSPFYLSSAGYGLFVEGTWLGMYDMAASDPERIHFSFDGPSLAYHVFTGGTPERLMEQYTSVIGRTLLPPDWTLGHWRWRDEHIQRDTLHDGTPYNGPINSELYEDIAMLEALDMPLEVYWVDRPWSPGAYGYDDFLWDRERLPNPEAMVAWLEDRGVKFLLWIGPWVMGDMAIEAIQEGYFLPSREQIERGLTTAAQATDPDFLRAYADALREDINGVSGRNIRRVPALLMGRTYTSEDAARADLRAYIDGATTTEDLQRLLIVPDGGQLLIDFTNPEAKAWWQESVATVLEVGVDGFKLDRAEEMVSRRRDVTAYDGRTMREIANDYPNLYIDATYEVTNRIHGDDMVLLPRAGFPGAQTQAVFWGGDHYNDWLGLRNALIGAQRASILGYPFWGSDTGGYFQPTYREVTARWLGMSAFHGIYEVGPTSNRAPWDMPTGPRYDAELVATYRLYTKVREAMQPYLQTLARAAHENGHPLVRPLFYHYPEDGTAWEVWDQFLLGPDVLVAPVITEGATEREVYLPSGTWTDAWTGDAIAGPATVTAPAPMHQTPIYLRQGASLTLPDLNALYQESLDLVNNLPPLTDGSEVALPTVE